MHQVYNIENASGKYGVTNYETLTVAHDLRAQGSHVGQMVFLQMGQDWSEFSCAFVRAAPQVHLAYKLKTRLTRVANER